jgi:hypothetical protein
LNQACLSGPLLSSRTPPPSPPPPHTHTGPLHPPCPPRRRSCRRSCRPPRRRWRARSGAFATLALSCRRPSCGPPLAPQRRRPRAGGWQRASAPTRSSALTAATSRRRGRGGGRARCRTATGRTRTWRVGGCLAGRRWRRSALGPMLLLPVGWLALAAALRDAWGRAGVAALCLAAAGGALAPMLLTCSPRPPCPPQPRRLEGHAQRQPRARCQAEVAAAAGRRGPAQARQRQQGRQQGIHALPVGRGGGGGGGRRRGGVAAAGQARLARQGPRRGKGHGEVGHRRGGRGKGRGLQDQPPAAAGRLPGAAPASWLVQPPAVLPRCH